MWKIKYTTKQIINKQIVVQSGSFKGRYYLNKWKEIRLAEIKSDAKFICEL